MSSPLVSVAVLFAKQAAPSTFTKDIGDRIGEAFTAYLAGKLDQASVADLLLSTVGTTVPLDKINAILTVPDTPLIAQPMPADALPTARKKSRPWTPQEDYRLLAGMHRFGIENWAAIATFVGNGRTRAQCAQRWFRGLDPRICKDQWTPEEEERLLTLLRMGGKGRGWTAVALEMGNRSDVQCRYHFMQMQRDGKVGDEFKEFMDHHAIPLPSKRPQIFQKMRQHLQARQNLALMQAPIRLTNSQPSLALSIMGSPPVNMWSASPRQEPVPPPLPKVPRRRTSSHVEMKPRPIVMEQAAENDSAGIFSDEDILGIIDRMPLEEKENESGPHSMSEWERDEWGDSDVFANSIW